jgi:hypothetical protein
MIDLSSIKARNLPDYLSSLGYRRQPGSTPNSVVMKAGEDRLIVKRDGSHWVYCSIGDHLDHGTIIDFTMRRDRLSFHEAVKRLDTNDRIPSPTETSPAPAPKPFDRGVILAGWNKAHWVAQHSYLLQRHIPPAVLSDSRFIDCWRQSSRGHCLFPYADEQGVTGFDLRDAGLKVFSRGGKKSLWSSANLASAARVVICESPVDCLSFHALYGGDHADAVWPLGYCAFGGGLGSLQRHLLTELLAGATHREFIIAVDSDPAGNEYADTLAGLAPVALERIRPVGKDFNADLCDMERS